MSEILVRQAQHQDLPAMVELLRQLFAIEADFHFNAVRQEQGLRLLLEKMALSGPGEEHAQLLVAESANKVVAMCSVQLLISTAMGGEVGLLEDFIVDAACRHSGVGKSLLTGMSAWCRQRGLLRLQLLADRDNQAALDFYTSHQWQTTKLQALHRFVHEN